MRLFKIFFLFLLMTTLFSCTKWLDVKPDTEKDRDELISTAAGFKQMLFGIYSGMVDNSLYGHQLTYGAIESAAYNNYFSYGGFTSWNYTSTENRPVMDAIWNKMYNTVANDNSILKAIDEKKSLFSAQEFALIKGESLALRAFMHFDLLRMYAPAYTLDSTVIAIPYVENYERIRSEHLRSSAVLAKVIRDLNEAEALLSVDPIFSIGLENSSSSKNDFLTNRQYRFNYWAVQALKARIYMYAGDKANAALYAKKVIEQGPFSWVDPTTLTGDSPDVVFMPELIFALNVSNLETYYQSYFATGFYSVGSGGSSYAATVFDDLNDYRYLYQMSADSYGNKTVSAKYKQKVNAYSTIKKQTMPMLRLGEMYLIAAECALDAGNKATSVSLMRELRFRRGYLSADRSIADNISDQNLKALMVKEFRKETFLEGQTFFNYKRLNQTYIPSFFSWFGEPIVGPVKFVFPVPEAEKEFGNIPSN
ncbi:RagB/SusD family nutrient uptake outer membrane protein [Pedobacter sp. AW31-3R]|uniref:RagB/SusD family nutrient uptake outer membrane protein n=1 Tax=Pedobacter sp. AW31-3R TaxID=3445781 RepID=UPI003F9F492A